MGRTQAMVLGLLLVAILVGGGLGSTTGVPGQAPGPPPEDAVEEPADQTLTAYVSGWVATPGVVRLPGGSIVADAIAAAGGAREGALLDAVNLAAPVLDGEHIQIPGPDEAAPTPGQDGDAGPISLNRADAEQLEKLPGVGPVLAERIVTHREANGPFQSVEDLLEVAGIGEAKLASIRDLVTVP